jgi:hypothetical protein
MTLMAPAAGRCVGVVARRNRVYDDGQGRLYGEVGGPGQYDSDRMEWRVGRAVRQLAEYWIIGVDGPVRRVYRIDPSTWRQVSPGYWEFLAVGNRECSDAEIASGYAAGDLPFRPGTPARPGQAARTAPTGSKRITQPGPVQAPCPPQAGQPHGLPGLSHASGALRTAPITNAPGS